VSVLNVSSLVGERYNVGVPIKKDRVGTFAMQFLSRANGVLFYASLISE